MINNFPTHCVLEKSEYAEHLYYETIPLTSIGWGEEGGSPRSGKETVTSKHGSRSNHQGNKLIKKGMEEIGKEI